MVDVAVMSQQSVAEEGRFRWRERLMRGKLAGNLAFWAAAVLLIFTALAVWPAALAPYNPRLGRLADRHKPPGYVDAAGGVHWLGTDHQGRDVLSRVIYGAQVSLTVGYSGVIIGALVGVAIGPLAGYRGGTFDQVAMRVVDAWLSFPYILIAIVWAVTIGSGVLNLVAILAVRGWVEFARVGRGQSLAIRQREYITAVRALVQSQGPFFAMRSCPLSLWERIRVRVPKVLRTDTAPHPRPLPRGEGAYHAQKGLLDTPKAEAIGALCYATCCRISWHPFWWWQVSNSDV